jgi:hypothetical protein
MEGHVGAADTVKLGQAAQQELKLKLTRSEVGQRQRDTILSESCLAPAAAHSRSFAHHASFLRCKDAPTLAARLPTLLATLNDVLTCLPRLLPHKHTLVR